MSNSALKYDVAIVIPSYEADLALVSAIESALNQPGVSCQVVIIEDGSRKPSIGLLRDHFSVEPDNHFQGGRIKYIAQQNAGAYRARLSALAYCDAPFLKFLDQDDVLLPGALGKELAAFEPEIDVVMSNWQIDHGAAHNIEHMRAPVYQAPVDDFLTVGGCFTSAVVYRMSVAKKALVPVSGFTPVKTDDWLIFAQVCLSGARYKTIDVESYVWNQHLGQLSKVAADELVDEHFFILDWIETELKNSERLSTAREHKLANYYAKQLLAAHAQSDKKLQRLLRKIDLLEPNLKIRWGNVLYRTLCNVFGIGRGINIYTKIRKIIARA